jgi:hypothetical protein
MEPCRCRSLWKPRGPRYAKCGGPLACAYPFWLTVKAWARLLLRGLS